MPIYEYQCKKCGSISEILVFNDREVLKCKACGSTELAKLVSAHNTIPSSPSHAVEAGGGCCGTPNSCRVPGSCCGK